MLQGHKRAVSDFHWNPIHPELLATCSYDAYIHLWDLRQKTDRPINSFCAWTAGATQVKWNPLNEFLFASSHDTDARIWDMRKGSSALTLITAHMKKIYGIDWSRIKETELVTCAQDGLVKIWDYTLPRNCLSAIHTGAPVWRARYTPFGNYLVTMPQRKDNSLYLWDCDDLSEPVFVFSGHTDVPTEFVWRVGHSEDPAMLDYQLITWAKDQNLRLWPLDLRDLRGLSAESETFPAIQPRLPILEEETMSRNSSVSGAQLGTFRADDSDIMVKLKELESPTLPLIHESSTTPTYPEQSDYHWEQLLSPDNEFQYLSIEREIQSLEQSIQTLKFDKIGSSCFHYGYVFELLPQKLS